ncbi:hypothetical protein FNV43_RR18308 [Rhamnella rubrinervis]|uniref:Uncharacterized protein n=1 Tax=Rhamnella rubrinervis TaxID=2594499 RepID=A0A8K0DZ61_9ROSA|nr:hypothetical protein FNV43_RR18308 [Rhamnella rubrinervis]
MADTEARSQKGNQLGSSKELHTSFGFIIGLMVTLAGVKYLGTGTTPFKEHSLVVSIFIMFVLVYGIALMRMTLDDDDDRNSNSAPTNYTSNSLHAYTYILIISGTIACELLLYVVVTPLVWFLIINAFTFIFAVVLRRSCHQQTSEPLLTVSSSDEVADHEPVHKLYEWIKRVILCRPSAPLDHTTHEEHDHTEHKPLACLVLNRMHGLIKQISGRLCSAPAITSSVEDEGHRDVQMSNNV